MPFSKEAKTLLTTLDLSGFALTENLLAQVLAAQRDTLRVIKAFDMDVRFYLFIFNVKLLFLVHPSVGYVSCL